MVIVSADAFTASAIRTLVAVALTPSLRLAGGPGNVRIRAGEAGVPRDSVANVSQVVTLDRALLLEHAGQLRPGTLAAIDDGLRLVLDR